MKKFAISAALVAAAGLFVAGTAFATPTTYFGQDQNPGTSTTNSDSAHDQFMSQLNGVGTEDFETFSNNQSNITLNFPGSLATTLTASLTGTGSTTSGNNAGAVAHSGSEYYLVVTGGGNEFHIDFGSAISAFGFYGSDISDSGSLFLLTLVDTLGNSHDVSVTNSSSNSSGNQLFFGFIDPTLSYTSIIFKSTGAGDYFGFDDMVIGDLGQVNPNVPEPAGLGMFGLGLLGLLSLAALRRRQG